MIIVNSAKLTADNNVLINGKPTLIKETEINGWDIVQEFHIPTRSKEIAESVFFKNYFFPEYSEEELVCGPGRPVTVRWNIKRNTHRTYIIKQELAFGMV